MHTVARRSRTGAAVRALVSGGVAGASLIRPPFTRLAEFGVQTAVPSVAEPPNAAVIRNLLSLWLRIHHAE